MSGVCEPCQSGDHYNCTPGGGRCGCKASLRTDGTWTDQPPAPASGITDAARLRSLAAWMDEHPDTPFKGAEVAAMLRDGDT